MYDRDLVELNSDVQFLTANDVVINTKIVKLTRVHFFVTSGEKFTRLTGKQVGNRVGKIINMFHFSRI